MHLCIFNIVGIRKQDEMLKDIKKIIIGILAIVLIIALIVIVRMPKSTDKKISGGLIKENRVLTVKMLSSKLNTIGELATEEFWYKEILDDADSRKLGDFKIPFTESRRIASYEGKIKAGIDVKKVDVQIDKSNKSVTVTLPKSKILSNEIDFESFKLYDDKSSIFTPLKMEKTNDEFKKLKKNAEKEATARKILEKADKENIKLYKNFISSLDMTNGYKVTVITAK